MVKGVWSLVTDLFLNRLVLSTKRHNSNAMFWASCYLPSAGRIVYCTLSVCQSQRTSPPFLSNLNFSIIVFCTTGSCPKICNRIFYTEENHSKQSVYVKRSACGWLEPFAHLIQLFSRLSSVFGCQWLLNEQIYTICLTMTVLSTDFHNIYIAVPGFPCTRGTQSKTYLYWIKYAVVYFSHSNKDNANTIDTVMVWSPPLALY